MEPGESDAVPLSGVADVSVPATSNGDPSYVNDPAVIGRLMFIVTVEDPEQVGHDNGNPTDSPDSIVDPPAETRKEMLLPWAGAPAVGLGGGVGGPRAGVGVARGSPVAHHEPNPILASDIGGETRVDD